METNLAISSHDSNPENHRKFLELYEPRPAALHCNRGTM